MTVTDLAETVTVTQTLTPIQEKTIFGVDIPAYLKNNDGGLCDTILDSTLAVLKKIEQKDEDLTKSWLESKKISNEFDFAILLYLLSCRQKENNNDNIDNINSFVFKTIASVNMKALPSFSNIMAWDSLDDISLFFSQTSFSSCTTLETFTSKFNQLYGKHESVFSKVLYFYFACNHFKNSSDQLELVCSAFESFFEACQKQLKFPTANETNAKSINSLVQLAIYLAQDSTMKKHLDIYHSTSKYIYVTYHNIRIMKLWCVNTLNLRTLEETRATFRTYLNYVADYKVKNNGEYYDIVDVIQTYVLVLEHLSSKMTTIEEYRELKVWFNEVLKIMDVFNAVVGTKVGVFKNSLRTIIATTYFSFASIYENFLNMEVKPFNQIDKICGFLAVTAQTLDHRSSELKLDDTEVSFIYYVYSFYLHKSRKNDDAIKYAKHAMRHSPDNIKYINYYVKLLSGNEDNLETALSISQQVIELLHQSINTEDPIKWSVDRKRDALEAYLIFLTLLGESAIDVLAPFFGFVNKVFGNQQTLEDVRNKNLNSKSKTSSNRNTKNRNNESDEICSPCVPNSSSSTSTNSQPVKERRLRSLLHIRRRNHEQSNSNNNSNRLGNSIRKSLQINRSNSTKSHDKHTTNVSRSAANYGSLTPKEVSSLRMMWLTLSRLFQAAGDIETSLQCVDEADEYSVAAMMLSSKNEKKINKEEQIHKCAIQSRRGCIYANSEDSEKLEEGKSCLLESVGIIEAAGGFRKWPKRETICATEAVVGLIQLILKRLDDPSKESQKEDDMICLARCRKHLEIIVEDVNWGDDARCWLLLGDVYQRKNMFSHDNEIVAVGPGELEEKCVMNGVHGWHGLQILQQ